jgi:serine/threonine protein kinase
MSVAAPINGRYEIEALLSRGDMSELFLGVDTRLDRPVVVKRVHRDLGGDPEVLARFEREVRLTARVSHPGLPSVYDAGSDGDGPYLVMERVEGATLRDLIDEVDSVPDGWVAAIGAQVCAILEQTHAVSLVHRDLKPANILLRPDGSVVVIDFGVATLVGGARLSTLTAPDAVVGTSGYQAPERRLGIESPLTDLYAVGCLLRELSSGRPPFADLVAELTAPRPQDRPTSARTVGDRLVGLVGPLPALPGFVPDPAAMTSHITAYRAERVQAPHRPTPFVLDDLPHLRRRAERLISSGRPGSAVELLDHLVESAASHIALLDLRWERAQALVGAGMTARAAIELAELVVPLTARLGPQHPVVLTVRLSHAQSVAACGKVREALVLLRSLGEDLQVAFGADDSRLQTVRREIGIQLAAAGDTDEARSTLEALASDQCEHLGAHSNDRAITLDVLAAI